MGVSRVRRRVIVATSVVVALAVAGLVARHLWLTDTARTVDAQEAVDRFREQQSTTAVDSGGPAPSSTAAPRQGSTVPDTTAAAPLASLPAAGVYRYTTTGSEEIDVLGGARHEYPAQTYITVTAEGCGVRMRWDLLQERWEDLAVCATPDGVELQPTSTNYHEFFQHGQEQIVQCDRTVVLVPRDGAPRPPIAPSCTQAGARWAPVWEVLERSTIEIDGAAVAVTHVRLTVTDDDEYWEHITADYWFDDHGLPVRMTATKENRTSSGLVGDVVYREQLTAQLASQTPLT